MGERIYEGDMKPHYGVFASFDERVIKSKPVVLRSTPLFFKDSADYPQVSDTRFSDFNNELRLWLLFSEGRYHVFINSGIYTWRINHDQGFLTPNDNDKRENNFDVSYPIHEVFESKEDAIKLYNKLEKLVDAVAVVESVVKEFNATDVAFFSWRYGQIKSVYYKELYSFNQSQKYAIGLKKWDLHDKYHILINGRFTIGFDNQDDRDSCWNYLVKFFDQFERKDISGISTELFLTDFLSDLSMYADSVDHMKKRDNKVVRLIAIHDGVRFNFAVYKGQIHICIDKLKSGTYDYEYEYDIDNMPALKDVLKECFLVWDFVKKYVS